MNAKRGRRKKPTLSDFPNGKSDREIEEYACKKVYEFLAGEEISEGLTVLLFILRNGTNNSHMLEDMILKREAGAVE